MKKKSLIIIGAFSLFAILMLSTNVQASSRDQKTIFSAGIRNYNVGVECGAGGSSGSDGSTDIMSAKNAELSFFNGNPSELSARWGDGDKETMQRLLDNYGELAVRMGNKYNVPYIAVLVQMRYEDPTSICGANNFWGNGCPPGTGAGGASIQGKNLGEGFDQYGKTLTNGYHDQAIGIADPKEYLEKIGPTWVQGNINGAGYGSIEGMKQSVDSLTAYINEIGWNGGFSGGGDSCSDSGSGGPGVITALDQYEVFSQWDDRWGGDTFCGNGDIHHSGCGMTAMAIIITSLTGKQVTPKTVNDEMNAANIYHCTTDGTLAPFKNIASFYNVTASDRVHSNSESDREAIIDALKTGKRVVAGGDYGYSQVGHFLAFMGIDASGNWLIADPNGSSSNTSKTTLTSSSNGKGAVSPDILMSRLMSYIIISP
ncbi:C39 family peptidase [Candidatus Saccharibacteria bacterium]|nr:C39 family peptidase [Candidatus Saccharibacteria bacterium]